jgi:hypothetical protein
VGWLVVADNQDDTTTPQSVAEREARDPSLTLECGELIQRIADGEDFAGQVLTISGIALGDANGGLLNIGTRKTFESHVFENFVSVYEVSRYVTEGTPVTLRVRVERSFAVTMEGKRFVTIECEDLR